MPNRAVKLGADYSIRKGGPTRKVRQKARMGKFKARLSKATKMLDRSHRALAKVFVAGLTPGAVYAAEITDFSKEDIGCLRTAALRCANLYARGAQLMQMGRPWSQVRPRGRGQLGTGPGFCQGSVGERS